MENRTKKKVTVNIAGAQLSLVTDETDVFVDAVADKVNERMMALTRANYRVNRTDAALLCAVDFCSDMLKAEKRMINLEAQVAIYDSNMRRLREEIIALKQQAGIPLDENDTAYVKELEAEGGHLNMEQLGEMLRATGDDRAEDKIRTLEKYLETRKKGDAEGQTKEDKLRYIESLLRGGSGNNG
ncbi:MAG: cell division protein ZapA [Ruminococcaceae bacterium]|nr:cell division protein ZapA [Oscillospiraceae bacterium]